MANTPEKTSGQTRGAQPSQAQPHPPQQPQQTGALRRREPFGTTRWGSPFGSLFQRWNEEMDRLFEDFGFGPSAIARADAASAWSPQIEMFQRGNDLIIRADLPGMAKDDVQVEVTDDAVAIHGERRSEHEEEREGWYRNERSYGSFSRTIPLPDGTIADSAKAKFNNGVLEITVQAPPREVSRGRKVNVE